MISASAASIVVGLLLWRLRPDNPTGGLLVLAGILWTVPGLRAYGNPWAFAVGQWFAGSQLLVFAHLLIAYPTGHLGSRSLRLLVGTGYSLMLLKLLSTMTWPPPHGGNALAVWDAPSLHDTFDAVANTAGVVYAVIGIAILARRWLRATPAARRVLGPVLGIAIVFAATAAADLIVPTSSEPQWVFLAPVVAQQLIPFAFLFGLMRERLHQVAIGDLVIELQAGGTQTLEHALARALRDSSLRLGYRWSDPGGSVRLL